MKALVAGISGLVGESVARELLCRGHEVVGFARTPSRVTVDVPVVKGDVFSGEGVDEALAGVDVAYYLIHALHTDDDAPYERDRRMAERFAEAARRNDVDRLVFLGIYDAPAAGRSRHLQSRLEVERIIVGATPRSIALRAGTVIGPSSTAQLFIRMVERAPLLPLGPWHADRQGVIDRTDIAKYLADAALYPRGGTFDVPATEIVTHEELLERIGTAVGRHPPIVRLPFDDRWLTPRIIAALTGMGRTFAESVMTMTRVGDLLPDASRVFPARSDHLPLDAALQALT